MAFKVTGDDTEIANRWSASPLRYGGDRGSIAKSLMQHLWQRGLHLLTARRTMKNLLFPLLDKLLLRKSSIIETLFAKLKPGMGLEHSRHRSPLNAFAQILSSLAQPKVNIGTATIP